MLAPTWITVGIVVSSVFLMLGLPLGLSWPYLFGSILQLELQLSPTSLMFSSLGPDSPIHIYMDIYLWNLTNSAEFDKDRTVIPHFEEVGPFVYQLQSERVNVTWNHNFTVSFASKTKYIFVEEESIDPTTLVTTINPVPAVVAYYARSWTSKLFSDIINKELEIREKFLKTDTAENFLFNGVEDTLVALMAPLKKVIDVNIPGEKFAWFFGKNDSTDGVLTMFTGADDLHKVGVLINWNGRNSSGAYEGACGAVGGSSGQAFPHMDEQPEFVSVFVPDACSQVSLEASGDAEVEGITGWKFIGGDRTLDNGTHNIENECFCPGECIPTGLRNVSACKSGAPAFVSFPHFYLADETYQSLVSGMNPNSSLHGSTMILEPTLGIPLSVRIQLQVNLMIQTYNNVPFYNDTPRIYAPVLWFRQRAAVTPGLANMLKIILSLPTVGLIVFYSVAGVALLALITFGYFSLKQKQIQVVEGNTKTIFTENYRAKTEMEIS